MNLRVLYIDKKFWEDLIVYFLRYHKDRVENHVTINSSIVAYVLVAGVTFLPSPFLATISEF
jgi:hypothetical protein